MIEQKTLTFNAQYVYYLYMHTMYYIGINHNVLIVGIVNMSNVLTNIKKHSITSKSMLGVRSSITINHLLNGKQTFI